MGGHKMNPTECEEAFVVLPVTGEIVKRGKGRRGQGGGAEGAGPVPRQANFEREP